MGDPGLQPRLIWEIARQQHGVVTRTQLLELGFTTKAIKHRIAIGRLHRVRRGVYAVGRPELGLHGHWMAAVLFCGPSAILSHESAAALWGILPVTVDPTVVSVITGVVRRSPGIEIHRRSCLRAEEITRHRGVPVTSPVCTMIDLAARQQRPRMEAAINTADKLDLVDPEELRYCLDRSTPRPGVAPLRAILDRRTFTLTDSELERRFLPVARAAGLSRPSTGVYVNGFKVDFFWPEVGLVVETDGLRYHRTPAQQARDRLRDQVHAAAGLTPLRFTRAQVVFEPSHVQSTLVAVARRLQTARTTG